MNSPRVRSGIIYLLLLVALGAFLYTTLERRPSANASTIALADVAEKVRAGEIARITIKDDRFFVEQRNGEALQSRKEEDTGLVETLGNLGVTTEQLNAVKIEVATPTLWENWGGLLMTLLPLLLLAGFFIFILRQAQGGGNQAFGFGKSRARMFSGETSTVTFQDVAGNEESKQELQEIVEFLKEPEKFAALGARIPKGVLLVGPPGTGKTLMAKAVSGEAGVPFFSISGSEFVEMFVGVGASRVRDLFEQAKKNSPAIIFIDEIDAVGRHRGAGMGGSHDEREQTLNQILVEMDGFDTDTNVIIIAATNRPDILDPALLRPGRFDRRVVMDAPDVAGRRQILDVHVRGKPLATDVDLDVVAKQTPGFAGADIENLVNEAAILAARRNRRSIGMEEFQEAIDRVSMGPERRSRLITPKEKKIIAYHEAGHAVSAHMQPGHDRVHKITIISRGQSLGHARYLPDEENKLRTKNRFISQLVSALGGRVAEEIKFGDITNGATSDLEQVTNVARSMVSQLGMSEKLGPIQYGQHEEMMFLGRAISEQRNYSDKVAQDIDEEVSQLVDDAYRRCHHVLEANWDKLEQVAQALLEHETISGSEFEAIMNGEDPFSDRTTAVTQSPSGQSATVSQPRLNDKRRSDTGTDLSGTLPAPA
ncbi:MAG: ATP-dependent zinc metalloprotease FtsH [Caldilineaceae bacterium]|nr:ATP-dependent zinc metalloprotease FtsH [Caldilineaceae bacterium]MCB9139893.1 ATP-dependent zinc metalloprotease FtsH [Caldilineaceae bacterium]